MPIQKRGLNAYTKKELNTYTKRELNTYIKIAQFFLEISREYTSAQVHLKNLHK